MARLSPKLIALLLLCGAIAGVAGIVLIGLLHFIQQIVYGISRVDGITFRNIVEQTSATHRLLALSGCGVVAGTGWFLLHRYAPKLIDIKQAIGNSGTPIPLSTTLMHGLLQILTVGMGSPLGRETAPREISSALADYISRRLSISTEERKILLACSAAAGLAAVFDVPLAGALFALETLLFSFQRNHVIAALTCCTTAAWVARVGLGSTPAYQLPAFTLNSPLLIWALLLGPVIVASSWLLQRQLAYCKPAARSNPKLIFISMAAFILIGVMAMWLPEILGNGKAGNELLFNASIGWHYALALLIGKWLALLLATRGGAYGGFITPSMMLGGLIALLAATAWNNVLPSVPIVAAVVTGATVFLAIQQKMPLTAILFVLEITNITPDFIMPVSLCLLTALLCQQALNKQ
ncbi:chloride channel protein [Snodgrassella sp. ESL0253]|uniref:chloride channel protein n=1 Tax=Snodgrassella sp. ESL0253 TaxID=2705031 RepID=UPI0015828D71|nr:chloride channel protein [Snodgrassella sp. ESL0253]NUE67308.1 chloride channel protein [Snodgrassella sp. ESL0253]